MRTVPALMVKDDYEPLPTPEQLRQRAAEAQVRDQIGRTIEVFEQIGNAAYAAARNIKRAMVVFGEGLKRLA